MSFDDRPVLALDDLDRDSVAPQFHAERLGTPEEGTFEDETFDEAHKGSETSGEEEESRADDSREVEGEDLEDHDSGDSDGDRVRRNYAGHHPSSDGPDKDMGIDRQEGDSMCITKEHMESCPDEQDMPLSLESKVCKAHIAHIQPYPDNHHVPVPTRTEEVQGIASFITN
ncbi:Hypothetical predicted protein [Olea europaea subsp. europaea]|uniref:Uncharacterized protein n=1 Tax=Olea europaea subsp. europaea TaxID=158383 RepID=A0A8S0T7X8_OLEEU|nr:Hypothetical predicted protein [Olea europaea subsp. europaea]